MFQGEPQSEAPNLEPPQCPQEPASKSTCAGSARPRPIRPWWEVGLFEGITCCECSFGGLLTPALLETTGLEEPSVPKCASPVALFKVPALRKQTLFAGFKRSNKLPRYPRSLIHPQIFDSSAMASQWVIISSLLSRELRISNLSPILGTLERHASRKMEFSCVTIPELGGHSPDSFYDFLSVKITTKRA